MTKTGRLASIALIVLIMLGLPAVQVHAAERHSGRVVEVDPSAGLIVIDVLGPWQVRGGQTQGTRQTIVVPASAKIVSHIRVNVPGRFEGDFLEVDLALADVAPGVFVTAEFRRERGRLVASSIAVAEAETSAILP